MFDEVPEPVWKTSIGNWSSCLPRATSSPAAAMRSPTSESSFPSATFARAAAALMRPSQWMTDGGTRSPDTGKFSTALRVSPPQSSVSDMAVRLSQPRGQPAAELGGVHRHADQLLLDAPARLVVDALCVLADHADDVAKLDGGMGVRGLPDLVCELVRRLDHVRSQCLYVRGARGVLEAVGERL